MLINLPRLTGIPVRDQLAGDLFWFTLFDSQGYQGHVRSTQAVCCRGGSWIRGLEQELDLPVLICVL